MHGLAHTFLKFLHGHLKKTLAHRHLKKTLAPRQFYLRRSSSILAAAFQCHSWTLVGRRCQPRSWHPPMGPARDLS
jgi:hypothetical protein